MSNQKTTGISNLPVLTDCQCAHISSLRRKLQSLKGFIVWTNKHSSGQRAFGISFVNAWHQLQLGKACTPVYCFVSLFLICFVLFILFCLLFSNGIRVKSWLGYLINLTNKKAMVKSVTFSIAMSKIYAKYTFSLSPDY